MFWLLFASGALTLSVALDATAVKVVPTDVSCPSGAQVQAALSARQGASPQGRGTFRLEVFRQAADLHITLRNERDAPVLERSFNAHNDACTVLADTVALVVARYLDDLHYQAPASLTPRKDDELPAAMRAAKPQVPWLFATALVGSVSTPTTPTTGAKNTVLAPGLLVRLSRRRLAFLNQWNLGLSSVDRAATGEVIRIHAPGVSVGMGLASSWDRWSFTPSLELGARVHRVEQEAARAKNVRWNIEPTANAHVRWLTAFHSVVMGLDLFAEVSLRPVTYDDTADNTIFATPRSLIGAAVLIGWGRVL